MSFRFINLPMWILLFMILSTYLVYIGIKRRKIDKKALIAVYFTIAPIGILSVIYRLINEFFEKYKKYSEYVFYVIVVLLIISFLEIVYLGITHKGDERSKRLIKIAFLIVIISAIPIFIMIFLDLLGVIK